MKNSKVIEFLSCVWESAGPTTEQLNHGMSGALKCAICYGFKFQPDDFQEIASRFRGVYWMGNSVGSELGEAFYCLACQKHGGRTRENRSAAISYEKWKGRKPFIVGGRRLCIGSEYRHQTEGRLWVTNIVDDKIRMAKYWSEDNPYGWQEGRPVKLFEFDHKDVKLEARV